MNTQPLRSDLARELDEFDHDLYAELNAQKRSDGTLPLIAHYTSLRVVEKIIHDNELWFSNPLFMNDRNEVTFGLGTGIQTAFASQSIRDSLKSPQNIQLFNHSLSKFSQNFAENHLLDTYVFCLSRHEESNVDGTLSMWRAYGGSGAGGALVFDPNVLADDQDSPFVAAPVSYKSTDEQQLWMNQLVERVASIFRKADCTREEIIAVVSRFFHRLLHYALFTKHRGFQEECEWRIVYFKYRDPENKYKDMQRYLNGPRGIEPKLHFKGTNLSRIDGTTISLSDMLKFIIIGPTNAHALARQSFCRMLENGEKAHLIGLVRESKIPLRLP